jgi:hypothetical protein
MTAQARGNFGGGDTRSRGGQAEAVRHGALSPGRCGCSGPAHRRAEGVWIGVAEDRAVVRGLWSHGVGSLQVGVASPVSGWAGRRTPWRHRCVAGPVDELAGVSAVVPHQGDPAVQRAEPGKQRYPGVAVLHARGGDQHHQQQAPGSPRPCALCGPPPSSRRPGLVRRRRRCRPPAGTASRRSPPSACGCRRTLLGKWSFNCFNPPIRAEV